MTTKKETRALKRDARMERRYGNPLLRKIADNDPATSMYYYRYRSKIQEERFDYIFACVFICFGLLELILSIFREDRLSAWFSIDLLLAMFWLVCSRISSMEAEYNADKLVTQASYEAKKKALKDVTGIDFDKKKEKK